MNAVKSWAASVKSACLLVSITTDYSYCKIQNKLNPFHQKMYMDCWAVIVILVASAATIKLVMQSEIETVEHYSNEVSFSRFAKSWAIIHNIVQNIILCT